MAKLPVIKSVRGLEVLDSRGNPTVEAQVVLDDGTIGRGIAPSGASTGSREAVELRDDDGSRYLRKGVLGAVQNINEAIGKALTGISPFDQSEVDSIMVDLDGSKNKQRLGANAIIAVSLATCKAAARSKGLELYEYLDDSSGLMLPRPFLNIFNGGAHANNNIDFQEFMIVPVASDQFCEALRQSVEVYHHLKKLLNQRGFSTTVGDEGGFAPDMEGNAQALDFIMEAIQSAGYTPGEDIAIALDVASSEFFEDGCYRLKAEGLNMDAAGFADYLQSLLERFPIISIEDGMAEQDWDGWKILTSQVGEKVQLIGDDLFVTNPSILQRGIERGVANSILIKINQIGTLTETLQAIRVAKEAGYRTMVSHRSGETEDTSIVDLAVAVSAGQIKTGAPCRTDRVAKYNRLLRIEQRLGSSGAGSMDSFEIQ